MKMLVFFNILLYFRGLIVVVVVVVVVFIVIVVCLFVSQTAVRPFLVDPSSQATEWLKTHLKDQRLEVVNQQVTFC